MSSGLQFEDSSEEYSYKVSANYLSNFMPKREYLEIALKNMAFIPRYYYEYLDEWCYNGQAHQRCLRTP